jgi:hypothetical protein
MPNPMLARIGHPAAVMGAQFVGAAGIVAG